MSKWLRCSSERVVNDINLLTNKRQWKKKLSEHDIEDYENNINEHDKSSMLA